MTSRPEPTSTSTPATTWPVPVALIVLVVLLGAMTASCARNYDASPDGAGENPSGEVDGVQGGPGESPTPPFLQTVGDTEMLHLRGANALRHFDLGEGLHLIATGPQLYQWNSRDDRLEAVSYLYQTFAGMQSLWNPQDGSGVLLKTDDIGRPSWYNARTAQVESVSFDPDPERFWAFERGFVATRRQAGTEGSVTFAIDEHLLLPSGDLDTEYVEVVTDSRVGTLRTVGNLYYYRNEAWDLVVQRLDASATPLSVIVNASSVFIFGDSRYLYVSASTPRVFDTETGETVEFPTGWQLYSIDNRVSEWVGLRSGTRAAFWRPGEEPIEVPQSDGFRGFRWFSVEPPFLSIYSESTDGLKMMIRSTERDQWWEIEGLEAADQFSRPTISESETGEPIVIWPSRFDGSDALAHYWRPGSAIEPLPGGESSVQPFAPTRDPLRFIGYTFQGDVVVADLERERLVVAGRGTQCGFNGYSSDGRFVGTRVDRTFMLFDSETLTSRVVARQPYFFGDLCEGSFNSAMSRGLFLNAFDGETGDLTYWDGESSSKVFDSVPLTTAELDPVSGTWAGAAWGETQVFLWIFVAETRSLIEVGTASADVLRNSFERDGQWFAFLNTSSGGDELRSTAYLYDPSIGETLGLVSGSYSSIGLLGDDVLLLNEGEEFDSVIIAVAGGGIDPGVLEDSLWEDPAGSDDETLRPPIK